MSALGYYWIIGGLTILAMVAGILLLARRFRATTLRCEGSFRVEEVSRHEVALPDFANLSPMSRKEYERWLEKLQAELERMESLEIENLAPPEEAAPSIEDRRSSLPQESVPERELPELEGLSVGPGLPALDPREYRVWFGTNRAPVDENDVSKGFSGARGERVRHGHCDVLVPEAHKVGSIGSSWWQRLLAGTDDRLKLRRVRGLDPDPFWAAVKAKLDAAEGEKHALVFIHGYNVSFEAAAIRAAQIGTDLSIDGAMAFFSWPSRGETDHYPTDGATIEASEGAIADFLAEFATKSGADPVHVLAHSMGNRGLLRAFNRILGRADLKEGRKFGQLILAAPDVDSGTFALLAGAYKEMASGTTLYVSSRDQALRLSRWLHDFPRVGLEPPVSIFPDIETISVTQIDLTLLGHGYIAEARPVLEDMRELIVHGARAGARKGRLAEKQDKQGRSYWAVKG